MRKKSFTKDCSSCEYCKVTDNSDFICIWGKGKPKLLKLNKTKLLLKCNLLNK